MTVRKTAAANLIYQCKVTLRDTRPEIWRRLLVPSELTLGQFHDVLQVAMGWQDCHLHEFQIGGESYGVRDANDGFGGEPGCINERKVRLSQKFSQPGDEAAYTYDFGDGWEHSIVLEKIIAPEAGVSYPFCAAGELHAPPEDCGGVGGYYELLDAIRDPNHEDHEEMLDWVGGAFDPESFSADDVNERLRWMFRPVRKSAGKRIDSRAKRAGGPADL